MKKIDMVILPSLKLFIIVSVEILIALTAFLALEPYIVWTSYSQWGKWIYPIFLILSCVSMGILLIVNKVRIVSKKKILFIIYIMGFFVFQHIHTWNGKISIEPGYFIIVVIICEILLLESEERVKILKYFTIIFALSLIPAIIYSVLNFINVPISYDILHSPNMGKTNSGFFYRHYFGSVFLDHEYNIGYLNQYKLCGMFDEPGTVGTIAALLLVGNQFWNNRDKKSLWIIFFAGGLSFSLAFYLMIFIYYAYKILFSFSKKVRKSYVLFLVSVIGISLALLSNKTIFEFIDNVIIQKIGRLFNDLSIGGNRITNEYKQNFSILANSYKVFWGLGYKAKASIAEFNGSFFTDLIIDYGILGTMLYCLLPILATMTCIHGEKKNWIFLFILFVSIYQRPQIFNLTYMIIIFGSMGLGG